MEEQDHTQYFLRDSMLLRILDDLQGIGVLESLIGKLEDEPDTVHMSMGEVAFLLLQEVLHHRENNRRLLDLFTQLDDLKSKHADMELLEFAEKIRITSAAIREVVTGIDDATIAPEG